MVTDIFPLRIVGPKRGRNHGGGRGEPRAVLSAKSRLGGRDVLETGGSWGREPWGWQAGGWACISVVPTQVCPQDGPTGAWPWPEGSSWCSAALLAVDFCSHKGVNGCSLNLKILMVPSHIHVFLIKKKKNCQGLGVAFCVGMLAEGRRGRWWLTVPALLQVLCRSSRPGPHPCCSGPSDRPQ